MQHFGIIFLRKTPCFSQNSQFRTKLQFLHSANSYYGLSEIRTHSCLYKWSPFFLEEIYPNISLFVNILNDTLIKNKRMWQKASEKRQSLNQCYPWSNQTIFLPGRTVCWTVSCQTTDNAKWFSGQKGKHLTPSHEKSRRHSADHASVLRWTANILAFLLSNTMLSSQLNIWHPIMKSRVGTR